MLHLIGLQEKLKMANRQITEYSVVAKGTGVINPTNTGFGLCVGFKFKQHEYRKNYRNRVPVIG